MYPLPKNSPLYSAPLILKSAVFFFALYYVTVGAADVMIYRKHRENNFTRKVETIFPFPAAVVGKDIVPLSRFRQEVSARQAYSAKHGLNSSESDIEKLVTNQLIDKTLYAQELKRQKISISEKDVDNRLETIYKQIGGQDKLAAFLNDNYGSQITLADFRVWIRESLYESAIEHQLLTQATVRHILIAVPENATDAQIEDARKKAADVKSKIADPSTFADSAKQFSEDVTSRDKGGELGTTVRGSDAPIYSKEFEDAIFSMPINQVSDPIRSKYGWHLVLVEKREGTINKSLTQFTNDLRASTKWEAFIGGK